MSVMTHRRFACLLSLAVVAACGGNVVVDGSSSVARPAPVDEASFPAALAAAMCDRAAECCTVAGYAGPIASCVSVRTAFYATQVEHAHALGAPFDSVKAAACLENVRTPSTHCPSFKQSFWGPLDCIDVYVGSRPVGATCVADWGECVSGDNAHGRCVGTVSSGGEQRTCMQFGLTDGDCNSPDVSLDCRVGSYCNHDNGNHQCAPVPKLGEACSRTNGDDCAPGLLCQGDVVAGTCAPPPKKIGEACSDGWQCEGVGCEGGRCILWGPFASEKLCVAR